jgi:hypothetical protein
VVKPRRLAFVAVVLTVACSVTWASAELVDDDPPGPVPAIVVERDATEPGGIDGGRRYAGAEGSGADRPGEETGRPRGGERDGAAPAPAPPPPPAGGGGAPDGGDDDADREGDDGNDG